MKPKLLVMELWGLGDLAIATPFLQAASEKFAVTLLAKPFALEMQSRFWPNVGVVPFQAPWTAFHHKYHLWRWPWGKMLRLQRQLHSQTFAFGVSARNGDPRDHLVLKLAGARERLGFPRLGSQRFLTQPLLRPNPLAHRSECWRVVGQALGLAIPAQVKFEAATHTTPPTVLLHCGARLPVRVWPLEHFQQLASRLRQELKVPVKIICDPDQLVWWQQRGETAVSPHNVAELLGLVDQAGVFIGNDSGPGHLAAACGMPTFTLFGPQLPEWFLPMHPASEFFEGHVCPYKPCSDYCRFAKPICLHDVTPVEVWPRVKSFVTRHIPVTS